MDNNKKHCKYTTPIILPKREREKKKPINSKCKSL